MSAFGGKGCQRVRDPTAEQYQTLLGIFSDDVGLGVTAGVTEKSPLVRDPRIPMLDTVHAASRRLDPKE